MDRFIAISKSRYRLYTYYLDTTTKRFERRGSWECAVGMPEYPTPSGLFTIGACALNPSWKLPESDLVPVDQRGKVIPGGHPDNPLVGAFLDLGFLGVGIHGTNNLESLGTRASHGCIRVEPRIAVALYNRFNKSDAPVYIY